MSADPTDTLVAFVEGIRDRTGCDLDAISAEFRVLDGAPMWIVTIAGVATRRVPGTAAPGDRLCAEDMGEDLQSAGEGATLTYLAMLGHGAIRPR